MNRADLLTERAPMEPTDEPRSESEPSEPERLTAPPGAPRDAAGVELDIGPRVTAVFTAAEKAAQHIVEMAREEAEDVRRRAEAEAESHDHAAPLPGRGGGRPARSRGARAGRPDPGRGRGDSPPDRGVRAAPRGADPRGDAAPRGARRMGARRSPRGRRPAQGGGGARDDSVLGAVAWSLAAAAPRRDVPPAAAMSGYAEPAGVEPGDELLEPGDERTDDPNRIPPP